MPKFCVGDKVKASEAFQAVDGTNVLGTSVHGNQTVGIVFERGLRTACFERQRYYRLADTAGWPIHRTFIAEELEACDA